VANEVLDAIRNRRSVLRFEGTPVEEDKVEAILKAGRWAPSWINKQPWSFIVIRDQETKDELSEAVPTTFVQGLKEAPVCIAVTVDANEDPYHPVEDGAAATQNMALAAHSLGLNTSWIGIYDLANQKNSAGRRKSNRAVASMRVLNQRPSSPFVIERRGLSIRKTPMAQIAALISAK
jgi:nitroreductase